MKKERYYYIRDEKNRPVITVCLVKAERVNGRDIARGVAICSEQDMLCKAVGRIIAKTRAIHALSSEEHSLEIRRFDFGSVRWAKAMFYSPYKSFFNPQLTEQEVRLFKKLG